jgi:hypothetical protein
MASRPSDPITISLLSWADSSLFALDAGQATRIAGPLPSPADIGWDARRHRSPCRFCWKTGWKSGSCHEADIEETQWRSVTRSDGPIGVAAGMGMAWVWGVAAA